MTSMILLGCSCICAFALASVLVYWHVRPNNSYIAEGLDFECWDVVRDGLHNAFIDMVYWKGHFYLVHRSAFTHLGLRSKLIVKRSPDAQVWENLAEFKVEGEDLRDPKLTIVHDRLFLYALKNRALFVKPYTTVYSFSYDGKTWEDWKEIEPAGWVFWRPTTNDNSTWYVVATWRDYKHTALFYSSDGMNWERASAVYEGGIHAEVAISFLAAERLVSTVRMAGATAAAVIGGSTDSTLVGVSQHPYAQWSFTKSDVTRLDGPALFSSDGKMYAVGRFEPPARGIVLRNGNFLCRKRTSLFLIQEDGLVYLSDLPSAGDTSYPGTVINGEYLYICYYTSSIDRDYPWFIGLLLPTNIRMAKIQLPTIPA